MKPKANRLLSLTLCAGIALATPPAAAEVANGRKLLVDNCGRCHAVEAEGASPMRNAPPFRDIYAGRATRELAAVILQGAVSHEPTMPQIEFSLVEVDAIIAYLQSISRTPPGKK
ncbi:MAG: cystathionine beta-lyase [Pseudomonadota bacterium]|jgi:mono/diheme cytochrome c family protein